MQHNAFFVVYKDERTLTTERGVSPCSIIKSISFRSHSPFILCYNVLRDYTIEFDDEMLIVVFEAVEENCEVKKAKKVVTYVLYFILSFIYIIKALQNNIEFFTT